MTFSIQAKTVKNSTVLIKTGWHILKYKLLLSTAVLMILTLSLNAQEGQLEIEGAIQIGDSTNPTPEAGTIRWSGNDFEGWNGTEWLSLTGCCDGPIVDGDGNVYTSITIGTQEWLTTDLRTATCNDGTPIPLVTDDAEWAALNTPGYTWFNNDEATQTADGYGALYNWYAATSCPICPTGWHVPSDEEWWTLITYLEVPDLAGGKMKETGFTHWLSPNTGATNESGWTGLPGGNRSTTGAFNDPGYVGYWWSTTTQSGDYAWPRYLVSYNEAAIRSTYNKKCGFSIRCLKD